MKTEAFCQIGTEHLGLNCFDVWDVGCMVGEIFPANDNIRFGGYAA